MAERAATSSEVAVNPLDDPSRAAVVERVNQMTRGSYQLVRPLFGGRQGGAWIVTDDNDPSGVERVLKWTMNQGLAERRQETAWFVEWLRAEGYPTPRWRAWGAFEDGLAFVIADRFGGTTASWAGLGADVLIDVVERQAALASPDACGAGTRAIDYAWLVRDAVTHDAPASTTSRLVGAGVAVGGPDVWSACVAFACLELVGFVARSGNRTGASAAIRRLSPLLYEVRTV